MTTEYELKKMWQQIVASGCKESGFAAIHNCSPYAECYSWFEDLLCE